MVSALSVLPPCAKAIVDAAAAIVKLMAAAQAELIKSDSKAVRPVCALVFFPTEDGVHRHGMGG
jgi:hypothetical protein